MSFGSDLLSLLLGIKNVIKAAIGGSAATHGGGNDTVEVHAGSPVTGPIDGGAGNDTLKLIGPGVGTLGANANFEKLDVRSGIWTLQSDAYDNAKIATGATVMSQLKLADEGEMKVAAGASVLVTNGSDAVVAQGTAVIENAGLVQALGVNGATAAKAIVTNGGEIQNKAGGIILAQGEAIATGAAATDGVDLVNKGLIQSLSGQAIALSGNQDDSVVNKGQIIGSVDLGAGDDTVDAYAGSSISGMIDGGEGDDTVNLLGTGTGALGATTNVENLVVQNGTWSVADSDYASIVIEDGATVTSTVALNNDDTLTVQNGGKLVAATAITWAGGGDAVVDNDGVIEASSRVLNTTAGATGSFTFNNLAEGVVRGALSPQESAAADATVTINNAGLMEASGRVIDFQDLAAGGAHVTINNLAGGTIQQTGSDTDVIRPGQNTTLNNWGTITTAPGFAGGGDLIDFQEDTGGKVNNYAGGTMEASRHVVTGDNAVRVLNEGTMIGRNGSAVNIDNGGSEAEKVFITNRGTMEGRSAELSDSDGDAIDVDGLAQVLNYGRIAGLGAEGYHDGEPNVSEGIAIGGGSIVNNAGGEIYGYGRAIQVDNSSNANALGATVVVNDGLIRGDGHGPEGVDPEDAARFDLRGNEAINLVGDYEDFVGNNSTGRIIGGISMGGGRDTLNNSGAIIATGGSAIDMGAGNDQVNLYVGSTVEGMILLGDGDDVASSTSAAAYVIDGGDGNDTISMYYTIFGGDDTLYGGAGNDAIYGGLGNDIIDGGADDDTLSGETGNDTIIGGSGADTIYGGTGNDRIVAGAGDTVDGGADNDVIEITTDTGAPASIEGGTGTDTVRLLGTGTGSLGATTGVETLAVQGGTWSVAGEAYKLVTVAAGASVTSQLTIAAQGSLVVDGSVQVASGHAVVAQGAVTIVNDGLIESGDDAAINLTGDYEDYVINTSTGRIVGGVSTGGARDTLNNSGAIIAAAGGPAIDMGAGNDQVNLYVGSTVEGMILLGDGDDVASSTSAAAYVIDGGAGNDSIFMYYTIFGGDDTLYGGAGNDIIYGGLGEDRIDGGADNDTLHGETGDDLILGGDGDDTIDGGTDDDVIYGDAGNDTITGGLGNDVIKGNAGDDTFVVTSTADGRDSYDGGAGVDTLDYSAVTTAVNLTLRDGSTTSHTDTIENVENAIGGSADDKLTGNSLDNVLTGNAGNDTLKGAAGNDTLNGGEGDDNLDGGADNDTVLGGSGNDVLKGAAGNDVLIGGAGNDTLTGGAGFDTFQFDSLVDGIDTITDFKVNGASMDQITLSAAMFENFSGDDAFDLIGSGFLRAVSGGGETELQIDVDGGGDAFQTLAILDGTFSNGMIADHLIVQPGLFA